MKLFLRRNFRKVPSIAENTTPSRKMAARDPARTCGQHEYFVLLCSVVDIGKQDSSRIHAHGSCLYLFEALRGMIHVSCPPPPPPRIYTHLPPPHALILILPTTTFPHTTGQIQDGMKAETRPTNGVEGRQPRSGGLETKNTTRDYSTSGYGSWNEFRPNYDTSPIDIGHPWGSSGDLEAVRFPRPFDRCLRLAYVPCGPYFLYVGVLLSPACSIGARPRVESRVELSYRMQSCAT